MGTIHPYLYDREHTLSYGILKAISYKKSILKILEKLFRAKGKGDSDIPYKDRFYKDRKQN